MLVLKRGREIPVGEAVAAVIICIKGSRFIHLSNYSGINVTWPEAGIWPTSRSVRRVKLSY